MLKKFLRITYKIEGLNLNRLINDLNKKGITLLNVRKIGSKTLFVTVSGTQNKKFFANLDNMCYNITKVKESGALYPFYYLYKNLGALFGVLFFIAGVCFYNNLLLGIKVCGSGNVCEREIRRTLKENGVKDFGYIDKISLKEIEKVLYLSGNYSFVSAKIKSNRLVITIELSPFTKDIIDGETTMLYSTADGVVESIRVYRGEAVVNVGDVVKTGDLLVSGSKLVGETETVTYVLASVTLKRQFDFYYQSESETDETRAFLLAKESLGEYEIADKEIIKTKENGVFNYFVKIYYRTIIYGGIND